MPEGAQHPEHLGQRAVLARDVAQPEPDEDAIEAAVGERQALGVALGVVQRCRRFLAIDETHAATREHRAVDVGEHHAPVAAHRGREARGQVAGAAGQIEDPGARTHARDVDGEPLPSRGGGRATSGRS